MWNVLVTGGGTIARVDEVRCLTNVSTGRFSASLSEACLERGANVWHLHAPGAELPVLRQARLDRLMPRLEEDAIRSRFETAVREWNVYRDRLRLISLEEGTVSEYSTRLHRILTTERIDAVFLAMAVSDYEPRAVPGKLSSNAGELLIRCGPTPKVIRSVRDWSPDTYLVGFKLLFGVSPERLVDVALQACRENRVDLTVANDLRDYQEGRHTLYLTRPSGEVERVGPEDGNLAAQLVERVRAWSSIEKPS